MGNRMAEYLAELQRQRQAKIEEKLANGYRPRLDARGKVVLVKVDSDAPRGAEAHRP